MKQGYKVDDFVKFFDDRLQRFAGSREHLADCESDVKNGCGICCIEKGNPNHDKIMDILNQSLKDYMEV